MNLKIEQEEIPLKIDKNGVVKVGGTRVTLDTVISAFREGATAEEIVYRYPTLHLADVYSVLSYYLRRTEEIENYLSRRREKAEEIHRQHRVFLDNRGIRERLLARQAKIG